MDDIITNEVKTSKKRIIGAALFGLILGGYIDNAFRFTIPNILAMVQKIDVEIAQLNYESSIIFSLVVRLVIAFFAAVIAGFIARRKGILAALLANSIYTLIFAGILIFAILEGTDKLVGNISLQLYTFIQFLFTLLASIFGGFFGERIYSPDKDLDLGNDKLTIFGIRWLHYFWILPFIFYPFLTSFIIISYAGVLTFLADFYFAIHPSIWFNVAWWIYFFIIPLVVFGAAWIMFGGFMRFYEIMQYKQIESRGWKKFGQVLLYGIGAPILSYGLAAFGANVTHNMPRPATRDWKIGLILILIMPTIAILVSIFSWIKEKVFHRY
jgi:hypothetical protein